MTLKKQEFYEGAALHLLARTGLVTNLSYVNPFFYLNGSIAALLKYSTRGRSPWGFTFTPDEQTILRKTAEKSQFKIVIGLVCGSDGVASFPYQSFQEIAGSRNTALHVSCYRPHRNHYEICGPDGTLRRKVAPSNWQKILDCEVGP
jgi:hypothetical protein